MIDREKVARAIIAVYDAHRPHGAASDLDAGPIDAKAADAAIAAVLEQLREPVLELVAFHNSGGHEGDGSDANLARIAAFLQAESSSNPAE